MTVRAEDNAVGLEEILANLKDAHASLQVAWDTSDHIEKEEIGIDIAILSMRLGSQMNVVRSGILSQTNHD